MALDLFSPLKVVSWASAHAGCPMRYKINSVDELVIIFGSDQGEFEFSFEAGALRRLLQLGAGALAEMEALAAEANGSALGIRGACGVNVPPPDHLGHRDRVLMAEIGKLNEQLGHYILRYLAADALQAEPISVSEERALAEAMAALASKVLERANRPVASGSSPTTVEGESRLRQVTDGRPSER